MNSLGTRAESSSLGGAASFAAVFHLYKPLFPANMLFAHAFLTAGTVCSVRSRNWIKDIGETPRVSAGIGLTFVYMNLLRFEINYVHPLRYVPGDSFATSRFQAGIGINFL